jgi:hypothetical protein
VKTQARASEIVPRGGHRVGICLLAFSLFLAGCERRRTHLIVEQLTPPSSIGLAPRLTTDPKGNAVLSWLEKVSDSDGRLRFSVQEGAGWSAPVTVIEGPVSTEELASAFVLSPGPQTLVAFWTEIRDHDYKAWTEFGYFSRSTDGGKTWSHPEALASDFSKTEHSYLSGALLDGGAVGVTWLDGRETVKIPYPAGHYHLMAGVLYSDGHYSGEKMLDDNVCTCCPTASVSLGNQMLIGYRDRTPDEIRDMNTIRFSEKLVIDGPYPVHHDGWRINACPTNGPALDVRDGKVVAAWFTAANGPRLLAATSPDGGKQFTAPQEVSGTGRALGHPTIALLQGGSSILGWIESGNPESRLLARELRNDGDLGPTVEIAHGSGFGYPSMRAQGNGALLTWMQAGQTGATVHLARIGSGRLQ